LILQIMYNLGMYPCCGDCQKNEAA
jgi:hypothetical protein